MDKIYRKDHLGNWTVQTFAEQCEEKILFSGRCQGVKGHTGDHWMYAENGVYRWMRQEDDKSDGIAGGMTPPGHKKYVNPVDKCADYFAYHYEVEDVTDKDLIAKLESDDDMGDGVVVDVPLIDEELKKLL